MMTNPITKEIREIRHRLAAEFDNDLERIFADLQRRERESGRETIDRRGERMLADNQVLHGSSGGETTLHNQSTPGTP